MAFACVAADGDGGSASSDDAVTASKREATTCAIRHAFEGASFIDFSPVDESGLGWDAGTSTMAMLEVPGIGRVFFATYEDEMTAFDEHGVRLARATRSGTMLTWSSPSGALARCDDGDAAAPSSADGGGDDDDPATCLSTTPIDATKYAYKSPAPAAAGRCTTTELLAIEDYLRAHSQDPDFSMAGWKAVVSTTCSSCAFASASDPTWAPIVEVAEADWMFEVLRGGCIEQVSHDPACGRAYHQLEKCTLDACLAKCKTQDEFARCRQDVTVLTTSCRAASEQARALCGKYEIGDYEKKCKGTTYTFDGPIKIACVTGL